MDKAEFSAEVVRKGAINTSALMGELMDAVANASSWSENCRLAEDTSWCIWPGQSDDGLKHAFPGDDMPPFPWENASDTRIRLVEEKIRECARVCMLAARRGNWSFQGVEGFDFMKARQMAQLLRWQESKQIPAARRERDLWIVWAWLYGCAVMGLGWETREELGLRKVGIEVLASLFIERFGEEAQLYLETLQEAITVPSPSAKEWIEEWVGEFYPQSSKKRRQGVAEALLAGGEADIEALRVVAEHPTWQAMVPYKDVFFPLDTDDLPRARWAATRRWMSRAEVENMRGEWKDEFIDKLLQQGGKCSTVGMDEYRGNESTGRRRWGGRRGSAFVNAAGYDDLYEVFYFYHYAVDEDNLPGLYCTVMSPHVVDEDHSAEKGSYLAAKQELYDDGSGKLPFEHYTIWDDRRALLECEGLPALLYTHQGEKKTMRDYRSDAASISILPPVRRHARDAGTPLVLGPDVPVYEQVRGSTEWMQPPASKTGMAIELERAVEREVNRFAGTYDQEVPAPIVQINQELIVDKFTEAYARVLRRTFQLDQMYLPEVVVTRVASSAGGPFKVSREEIQGEFDVTITFDPRELDLDFAMKKFEAAVRVATQLDRNAITDTNQLVRFGYNVIDPSWADTLVRDEHAAGAEEEREARAAVSDIVSGQEPPLTESMNSQIRLMYLQGQMQTNALLAAIAQNPEDPRHANLQKYMQHLEFMYQQQYVNPQTGRLGVNQNQPGEDTRYAG